MAAFAYLLLPVTGLVAFAASHRPRVRFHGLQAIAIGLVWGLAMYLASALGTVATILVALAGVVVWLGFFVATAFGHDPRLPWIASAAERLTEDESS